MMGSRSTTTFSGHSTLLIHYIYSDSGAVRQIPTLGTNAGTSTTIVSGVDMPYRCTTTTFLKHRRREFITIKAAPGWGTA